MIFTIKCYFDFNVFVPTTNTDFFFGVNDSLLNETTATKKNTYQLNTFFKIYI